MSIKPICSVPHFPYLGSSRYLINITCLGLGASIARHLAGKGCNVLAVYTSESSTSLAADLCSDLSNQYNVQAHAVKADLLEPETAAKTILQGAKDNFTETVGGDDTANLTINILINNAGVGGSYPLEAVPSQEFHRIYTVNVLAPIMLTQAVIPYLPHDRSGRIINVSSVASSMGFEKHTLYGGTKAALEAMTRTWARELAERATVNAVNPGPVEMDKYFAAGEKYWEYMKSYQLNCPLSAVRDGVDDLELVQLSIDKMGGRRPGYASEVAAVVGMLCSAESAWCTGSVVCANGGFRFTT